MSGTFSIRRAILPPDCIVSVAPTLWTEAERRLLQLAGDVLRRVPAYPQFLQRRAHTTCAPKTVAEFRCLPLMTKAGYIRAFPLRERVWDGDLAGASRLAVSSGSTGDPMIWPRASRHEAAIVERFGDVLGDDGFGRAKTRTLAVVCFALGNWVGGMYTTSCLWTLADQGFPLSVATPGNRKEEIFRIVSEIGANFERIILLGYPPFIRDVIDTGAESGVDWKQFDVRLVLAGEVFSEEWRSLLAFRLGNTDIARVAASLYGTADGGVLGNETPLSVSIRRFFSDNPEAARVMFGEPRLPTLVQYDPAMRYFEVHEETLVVSGDSGVPLVRYHIADKGGVIGFDDMLVQLADLGAPVLSEYGLTPGSTVREYPFAFVFGRRDFTISYYGANIFPENVSVGIERSRHTHALTGKFVMGVDENTSESVSSWYLILELAARSELSADAMKELSETIRRELVRLNSEFANYVPVERQLPAISVRAFEDPECFPLGVKHRYTRA